MSIANSLSTPEGYTARTLTQTVTISFETPSTLNFYHTVKSALTVKKVDADSQLRLLVVLNGQDNGLVVANLKAAGSCIQDIALGSCARDQGSCWLHRPDSDPDRDDHL